MPTIPQHSGEMAYSLSRKCPLCSSNTCTAHHVLSSCYSALSDGQYTWRYNRVLAKLFQFVKEHNPSATVFADIPSPRACESPPATVPTQPATTTARSDIVLYQDKSVTLLELTVPWNSATTLASAKSRKWNKPLYQLLILDLSHSGFSARHLTMEIGRLAMGHYSNEAYNCP